MKRWVIILLVTALLLMGAAHAEDVMAQLRGMRKSAGDRILEMEPVVTPEPGDSSETVPESASTPLPEESYAPVNSGASGDAVKAVQQRLIDLGYLAGKADGYYGAKTVKAVKAFQKAMGLPVTGNADDATQRALYLSASEEAGQYEMLDYQKALAESGDYRDKRVSFGGNVLQVLEDESYADTLGVYTALRVAVSGSFDEVVYVTFFRESSDPPVQEGDSVSVRGVTRGTYSYQTEAGNTIILPRIEADGIARLSQ